MLLQNPDRRCGYNAPLCILFQACLASEACLNGLLTDIRGPVACNRVLAAQLAALFADARRANGDRVVYQDAFIAALKAAVPDFDNMTDHDGADVLLALWSQLPGLASAFAVEVEMTITCTSCGAASSSTEQLPLWALPVCPTLADSVALFLSPNSLESPCTKWQQQRGAECKGQRALRTRVAVLPDVLLVSLQRKIGGTPRTDTSPIVYGTDADIGALTIGSSRVFDLEGVMRFQGKCQADAHYNTLLRDDKGGCNLWDNDNPRKPLPLESLIDAKGATALLLTVCVYE